MIIHPPLRRCDQLPCSVFLNPRGTPLLDDAGDQTSEHGITDFVGHICIQLNKHKLPFVDTGLLPSLSLNHQEQLQVSRAFCLWLALRTFP